MKMELNYYELEPEDNTFPEVVADITHRCNMTCRNCYIPNRDVPDMDIDRLIDCVSRFPKRIMIRLIGAEPTMRKDLPDIIRRIRAAGHRVVVLSNGLRLARKSYAQELRDAGLRHCYISLNGVDNDDWYEEIDELRCATKKVQALENMRDVKFTIDVGCILVKGCNDEAPARMLKLMDEKGIENCVMRFKNIGQIGRYIDVPNWTLDELIGVVAQQVGVTKDYIYSWQNSWADRESEVEPDSFYFPVGHDGKSFHRYGRWIKIVNWDVTGKVTPLSNRKTRGRITPDFKVAPFFEHVKLNEGGY